MSEDSLDYNLTSSDDLSVTTGIITSSDNWQQVTISNITSSDNWHVPNSNRLFYGIGEREAEKRHREDKMYMQIAYTVAERSACERKKVGAVIVRDGNILSYGWNGMPRGYDNVCEIDGATNPLVIHAERNALNKLRRSTETSEDAVLYVTMAPCVHCAIEAIDAGIRTVYYSEIYRSEDGLDVLRKNGVDVRHIDHN